MKSLFAVIFGLLCAFTTLSTVLADEPICGSAPSLPTTANSSESLKGQLQGQADFLSKLVGKAELAGQVEAARNSIYQTSDAFFAAQKEAYLAYMFCLIVMKDTSLSPKDKIDAISNFRRPVGAEKAKNDAQRKLKLDRLSSYVNNAMSIQDTFAKTNDEAAINRDYKAWFDVVYNDLSQNFGNFSSSYAAEFRSAHGNGQMLVDHSIEGGAIYADMTGKMDALNKIIVDVRNSP